jgi:diguanylate cyclase (GGDEF)-like protein
VLVGEQRKRTLGGGSPRLVQWFAVFTALGLAAAATAILIVVRRADTAQAELEAIGRARLATKAALDSELRTADLASRVPTARRRELDRVFRSHVLVEGITGGALVDAAGRVRYATHGAAIPATTVSELERALGGSLVSHVRDTPEGRILQTYVPLSLGGKSVDGVVVLDQVYGPIEAAAKRTSWHIALILEALLLLLCLMFVPPLARMSSRLSSHVRRLEHLATHDELTGLLNRIGFRRVTRADLANTGPIGAIVRLDLDEFSAIGDLLGLEHADTLLANVAGRLQEDFSETTVVARLGDDEFAFFVRRGDRLDVEMLAEAIRRSFEKPFEVAGSPLHVTIAMGAALLPDHGSDVDTVLCHAGSALAVAKSERRAVVEIYDAGHEVREATRLAMATEFREALRAGELILHYQPLVDVTTRTVRGVEGLLRWPHEHHGLLEAKAFISYAERSGISRELRQFVLESAARQWREWATFGLDLEIAVNLGELDLLDASLPAELEELLERYQVPPWSLMLEITERALDGELVRIERTLEQLRQVGVRLAIDDFGTGYSSLASLRRHPVDRVKLDRSLIAGTPEDPAGAAIVRGAVAIAHAVGATVVAEGVETAAEWDFVVASGCDVAQGYLTGPAVPAGDLAALVQADPAVTMAAA